jgi:hypothetical protein
VYRNCSVSIRALLVIMERAQSIIVLQTIDGMRNEVVTDHVFKPALPVTSRRHPVFAYGGYRNSVIVTPSDRIGFDLSVDTRIMNQRSRHFERNNYMAIGDRDRSRLAEGDTHRFAPNSGVYLASTVVEFNGPALPGVTPPTMGEIRYSRMETEHRFHPVDSTGEKLGFTVFREAGSDLCRSDDYYEVDTQHIRHVTDMVRVLRRTCTTGLTLWATPRIIPNVRPAEDIVADGGGLTGESIGDGLIRFVEGRAGAPVLTARVFGDFSYLLNQGADGTLYVEHVIFVHQLDFDATFAWLSEYNGAGLGLLGIIYDLHTEAVDFRFKTRAPGHQHTEKLARDLEAYSVRASNRRRRELDVDQPRISSLVDSVIWAEFAMRDYREFVALMGDAEGGETDDEDEDEDELGDEDDMVIWLMEKRLLTDRERGLVPVHFEKKK